MKTGFAGGAIRIGLSGSSETVTCFATPEQHPHGRQNPFSSPIVPNPTRQADQCNSREAMPGFGVATLNAPVANSGPTSWPEAPVEEICCANATTPSNVVESSENSEWTIAEHSHVSLTTPENTARLHGLRRSP